MFSDYNVHMCCSCVFYSPFETIEISAKSCLCDDAYGEVGGQVMWWWLTVIKTTLCDYFKLAKSNKMYSEAHPERRV